MPVDVKYVQGGRGIEFIATGVVTGSDIIETNQQIYTPEHLSRLIYKLIDRTTCTDYRVTSADIRRIAQQDQAAAKLNPDFIVVIISTTALQYGMTRVWQVFTDSSGLRRQILPDRPSAVAWLREHVPGYEDETE